MSDRPEDQAGWYSYPAEVTECVAKGDFMRAIDMLIARHDAIPDALLEAASAKLTREGTGGAIYKVERYMGRVRISVRVPKKARQLPLF